MHRVCTALIRSLAPTGFLLALLTLSSTASAVNFEANTMRFDRITVADGLAQSSVMAIAQDNYGFLWFATESGLNRYDGINFKLYRSERGKPGTLASDFVRDLHLAVDGSLWIASDGGGISRWDPATDTVETYRHDVSAPTSLATDRIRTILADKDGTVWVGTRDAGLDRLNVVTGEFTHYRGGTDTGGELSSNEIYALATRGNGVLWIATSAGLDRLNVATGEIINYPLVDSAGMKVESIGVRDIHIASDGMLWVGTGTHGLFRVDPESGSSSQYRHDPEAPRSLASDRIEVIFQDDRDQLWIGTDKGLNLMDTATGDFLLFANDPADPTSLSGNSIFSIFQDAGGLLWVGTRTSGLSKWNPRSWSFGHFKPRVGESGGFTTANTTAFTEDYDGNAWVGTFGGGINVVDGNGRVIRQIRHDPGARNSIGGDRVMALITDRHGYIWAGTMRGGLSRIDPATGDAITYRHDPANSNSLAANGVMSLLQDNAGRIWAGTFGGGVSQFDPRTGVFTNHAPDPQIKKSLSSPRATALAQTRDGVIWVGTDGGGLNYLNAQTGEWHQLLHNPDDPQSLSANTIYTLHVDPRGRLWVGSREGLDRVSAWPMTGIGARVLDVAAPDSVNRDAVFGIQSDMHGNLWISSSKGLSSFNPDTGETRTFHESQGLQGEEFNFGASYGSPDGTLYFGGAHGFNRFKPAGLEVNERPPPVVLTFLSLINEPVDSELPYELISGLDLTYRDYVVTFGVSALDFTAPRENRYSYMLEGFDDDWVDAGNERRITYTNLDGGNYTLRVRAANSDGFWNETGIAIPVRVAHPPWQTWWAYAIYAIVFLTVMLAIWRQQAQKLRRESEYSRRLENEVQERTQELHDRNKDLKVVNDKLVEASTTDALTGLRNRRYLFQNVDQQVDLVLRRYRDGVEDVPPGSNSDLLFLMVDLDNFKPVNDNCGHEAGDRLLLQVRDVLLEVCRKSDDVIRWGGDEFLIVAKDTNSMYAADLAERVRASLSDRVFPVGDGQVARITTSVGYASYPFIKDRPDLLSWEEVLGVADAAMYEAKSRRNSWLGIEGASWAGSGDELYRAIKSSPATLAEDGAIRAVESIEEAMQASL